MQEEINIFCNNILNMDLNYHSNIDNLNLYDLIKLLLQNKMLPKLDKVLVAINNNTYLTYGLNNITREYLIKELKLRKNILENINIFIEDFNIYKKNIIDIIILYCYYKSNNKTNCFNEEKYIKSNKLIKVLNNTLKESQY